MYLSPRSKPSGGEIKSIQRRKCAILALSECHYPGRIAFIEGGSVANKISWNLGKKCNNTNSILIVSIFVVVWQRWLWKSSVTIFSTKRETNKFLVCKAIFGRHWYNWTTVYYKQSSMWRQSHLLWFFLYTHFKNINTCPLLSISVGFWDIYLKTKNHKS